MWVRIDAAAFPRPAPLGHDLALMGVLALCQELGHRLVGDAGPLLAWARGLGGDWADVVEMLLDRGQAAAAVGAERDELRVAGPGHPPTWGAPLTLAVIDAVRLLVRPLDVHVENNRADRDFLLAFAAVGQHRDLREAEACGRLRFVQGGGSGHLKLLAERLGQMGRGGSPVSTADGVERAMTVIVADADGLRVEPTGGKVRAARSPTANAIAAGLADVHAQTGRWAGAVLPWREPENHAPPAALVAWCEADAARSTTRPRARAWAELSDAQRAVLDTKKGAPRGGSAQTSDPAVWATLTPAQQEALAVGFGNAIGEFYAHHANGGGGLPDPSGGLGEILTALVRRL